MHILRFGACVFVYVYIYIHTEHSSELWEKSEGASGNLLSLTFIYNRPQYVRIQSFGSVVCTTVLGWLFKFNTKHNLQVT